MPSIYYIVSGVVMEILQILLSLLGQDKSEDNLKSIISLILNSFPDLKNLAEKLNLSAILPIIKNIFSQNEKCSTEFVEQGVGLDPIVNIADKDIVYTLGRYFHQCS